MSKAQKIIKSPILKLGFLVLFLILFFGYAKYNFFAQASNERVNIYPQSVAEESNVADVDSPNLSGGFLWKSGEKAFFIDNDPLTDFSGFNDGGSAELVFGEMPAEAVAGSASPEVASSSVSGGAIVPESGINPPSAESVPAATGDQPAPADSNSSSDNEIVPPVVSPDAEINSTAPADNSSDNGLLPKAAPAADSQTYGHLPEAAPADNEPSSSESSNQVLPVSGEVQTSQPAASENDVQAPAVETSGSEAPVSFLENLKIAEKGMSLLWKKIIHAPKALAENNSSADLAATSSEGNIATTSKPTEWKDSLVFSDFGLSGYTAGSEITNVQLRLSLAAKSNFSFDHILVEYSNGSDWQEAGNLFLQGGVSNSSNGGYFLYALPIFSSWNSLDDLKVRVSYVNGEISAADMKNKGAKIYLDSIWLEVDYNQGKVKGAKDLNQEKPAKNIVLGEEKRFFGEDHLEVDGKVVDFSNTDDNSGENLIVKSDQQSYIGLSQTDVYLSVTNAGVQAENFGLQAYFSSASGSVSSVEKLSRKYVAREEQIYGTLVYFCADGWQAATSSEGDYACVGKDSFKQCNSLSRDGKKCRQENSVIGTAPAIVPEDEWKNSALRRGRLEDKRNMLEKLFSLGPKRKTVPESFIPDSSTEAEKYLIEPGETQYFKMKLNFSVGSQGEFYIETIGDKQGYGLLDPWWNASWDYYVPITVSYAGAATLSDFQVSATVNTAALITAGKMKSDCSDVRFGDSDRWSDTSELSYFLEPGTCNKTTTKFWVKVPSITATKTIYLYYGNTSAASVSSGQNTFVYFNDFEASNDFTSGSLAVARAGGVAAKAGSFGLESNSAAVKHLATNPNSAPGRNLIWESWVNSQSSSTVVAMPSIQVAHPTGGAELLGYTVYLDTRTTGLLAIRKDFDQAQVIASKVYANTTNTWYFLQFTWRSTGYLGASVYASATTTTALATCTTTNASYTNGEYGVAANQFAAWDNYRIRKYASSTVSTSLGSETAITNHVPLNPFSMVQYESDAVTAIANGGITIQNEVNLAATSTDKDGNSMTYYYQLATTSGAFLTATTTPDNVCSSGTPYGSCSSRVWINITVPAGWLDIDYPYRTTITVNASQVRGALASFPVYLDLKRLGTSHSFWSHTKKNSSGGDLIITDLSGTRLPLEVVAMSTSSKTGEAYFRATAISSSSNISFYLYYGSSTAVQPAVTSSYGRNAVWSNKYIGVWHLQESGNGTSDEYVDSTGKGNDGQGGAGTAAYVPSRVAGKIGYSQQFDGANDGINITDNATIENLNGLAISYWVYPDNVTGERPGMFKGPDGGEAYLMEHGYYMDANEIWLSINRAAGSYEEHTTNNIMAATQWQYLTTTWTQAETIRIYHNGSEDTSTTAAGTSPATISGTVSDLVIGGSPGWDMSHLGEMDEIRIASSTRSAKWIGTEYNNQNSPSTFFSTTTEESGGNLIVKKVNIKTIPDGGYKWQAQACDSLGGCSSWTPFNAAVPNFTIDATAPIFSNTITYLASTTNSIKLAYPTAVTEANFKEYRIYYKTGSTTNIHETDTLISSSTSGYSYLGYQDFQNKSSTTISGFATGTVYSFSLWAYDTLGNESSSTLTWERTDRLPTTASFNSAAQRSDGTGRADISINVNDPDKDTQLMAKFEYIAGANCHANTVMTKTTNLDETPANVSATQGTVVVQNKNAYQVGTSTGYITTAAGANTVSFDWLTKADLPAANGTYCLRITVNDNKGGYKIGTTTMTVDNVAPAVPGSLTFRKNAITSITVKLNATSSDANFSRYKIFYKLGAPNIHKTDSEFSGLTTPGDTALDNVDFLHHSTTTVSVLSVGSTYYLNIWAFDAYGNRASSTAELRATTTTPLLPANPSSLNQYQADAVTAITNGSCANDDQVNLYATSSIGNSNPLVLYYQLATTSGSFLTATTVPSNACNSGTAYGSCASRVWKNLSLDLSWYNDSFPYRAKITVLATRVTGALTDFPVYFNLARLGTAHSFWSHTNKDSLGEDLLMTDINGTRLALEVVKVSTSSKNGEIYFKAASISSSSNISFYLYYGSSTASQPASTTASIGSRRVWSNGYAGVWHLQGNGWNAASSSLNGAVSGAPTLTATPFGYGYTFNGTSQYLGQAATNRLAISYPFTMSAWVKPNDTVDAQGSVLTMTLGAGGSAYNLITTGSTNFGDVYGDTYTYDVGTDVGEDLYDGSLGLANGAYHYISGVWKGQTSRSVYVDSNTPVNSTTDIPFVSASINRWAIGREYSWGAGSNYYSGVIDEVRMSRRERSKKWINTEYNNQSNPSTFFSTSTEEVGGNTVVEKVNIKTIADGGYKWQALACDTVTTGCSRVWTKFNVTTPNFLIDNLPPVFTNTFTYLASTTNSIKLAYPSPVTEVSFNEYRIYYKTGSTTNIHETDSVISSSTSGYSYLGYQNFQNKSSTTISGFATGTVYSFSLWAYDLVGHKSSSTLTWERTDRLPTTALFNSAAQRTDGTGRADISISVNDPDKDVQLMAKFEYVAGTTCHANTAMTRSTNLDETPANVSATQGTVVVKNKNAYQIGTSTGWITTAAGANTVSFDWLSKADLPAANGTYCLRITVNDNKGGYKIGTTTMTVDNAAPTAPGPLTLSKRSNSSITTKLNATSTETNFLRYKIFYKAGSGNVHETDIEFSGSSNPGDTALNDVNFLHHSTSTITGLNVGVGYYFNIWSYDAYGNKASGTPELYATTTMPSLPNTPYNLNQYRIDKTTLIGNGAAITDTEVNLYATSSIGNSDPLFLYYQLATTSGSFRTATSVPSSFCQSGTTYANCPSRVWVTGSSSSWFDSDYLYRIKITVPSSKVAANQTNFPVYLDLSHLGASNSFWSHTRKNSLGGDIVLTNSSGTRLPVEVVLVSTSSKTGEIYFKADTLLSSADTNFYLYYGSSTAAQPAANSTYGRFNVWSAYVAVWHMNEDPSLTTQGPCGGSTVNACDSGSQTLDLTANGIVSSANSVTGKLGKAVYFNGADNYLSTTTNLSTWLGKNVQLSAWVNYTSTGNNTYWQAPGITGVESAGDSADIFWGWIDASGYMNMQRGDTAGTRSSAALNNGAWHYVVMNRIATTTGAVSMYVDGSLNSTATSEVGNNPTAFYRIGSIEDTGGTPTFYNGNLDEVRVRLGTTTTSWVATEYNNQNSPETFFSTTTEQGVTVNVKYADIKNLPDGNYKWQVLSCDSVTAGCSEWIAYNASTPNFIIDTTPPIFIDTFTALDYSTSSIKLGYPTAATEISFYQYKIFYKIGSTAAIHETDMMIGSSTLSDLNSRTFNGESSTTISGLLPGTTYSFSLWAYDRVGNKSSSTLMWKSTDRPPTAVFNTAAQRANGTGRADISFVANDLDQDTQLSAKFEYVIGTNCHVNTVMNKPSSLDETPSNISATYGTVVLQNKNAYQIGTSTGYITTASGANTINFDWLTKADLPNADASYCLRLTLKDNRGGYQVATTTMYVDNKPPFMLGSLTLSKRAGVSITPFFGAAPAETNFFQYKIFYKPGSSGVRETDAMFGSSTIPGDIALASLNYLLHSTTTIFGLAGNTKYVFNIWAYDLFGNKASGTTELVASTTNAYYPTNPSGLSQYRADGVTALGNGVWTPESQVYLKATSTISNGDPITIYYQLIPSGSSFLTATATPSNACSSGTDYASCAVNIWYSSGSTKKANITAIPDSLAGYKWQTLACGANGCSKTWVQFNASTPNFKVDANAPTLPGGLSLVTKGASTVQLYFGAATVDPGFYQYKIFYKIGTAGVKETDTLFGSSSASSLGFISYNGKSSTTITGLTPGANYVFNIYAYDVFGRKASSSNELPVSLGARPANPSSLYQYRQDGSTLLPNTSWINSGAVTLAATSSSGTVFYTYYELIPTTTAFTTSTSTPATPCNIGTSYTACSGKIWRNTSISNWFDLDYPYRTTITVNTSGVAGALTNFPVYLDLARLGTGHSFWSHTRKNSLGGDILVTDSGGTRIPVEVLSVSTSSKIGEVYFKASSLSSTTASSFYLYYGSSTAAQPASTTAVFGSRQAWSNNYIAVYHLNESGTGADNDWRNSASSTLNSSASTTAPTRTTWANGKLGYAQTFASGDRIIVADNGVLGFTAAQSFSLSVWVNDPSLPGAWNGVVTHGRENYPPANWYGLWEDAGNNWTWGATTNWSYGLASTGWHLINLTQVGNTSQYMYVDNGAPAANGAAQDGSNVGKLFIGGAGNNTEPYTGVLDEVRISKTARSAKWVTTEYNNQKTPSTFFSTTTEEGMIVSRNVPIIAISDGGYKWQALACNSNGCSSWSKFNLTLPNFRMDTTPPTAPGSLTLLARQTNSITLGFGSASTETNFRQYKIFYKAGSSGVTEANTLFGSSSAASLGYINYNGASSTIITGLSPNTQYVFNIWAYDQAGNKAYATEVSFQTAAAATLTYYYSSGASNGWTNPTYAWNNIDNTYAYRSIPGYSVDDSASYLRGTANNVSDLSLSILGVELGLEGYTDDPNNISFKILPIFNGLTAGVTSTLSGTLFGYTDSNNTYYVDITHDAEAPAVWSWDDLINLEAKVFAANAYPAGETAYVDQIRLRVTFDSLPNNPVNLQQYKSDKVTAIANNSWLTQNDIVLKAEATDPDNPELLSLYYQFISTAQAFISSTTRPVSVCSSGTAYGSCSSKIWVAPYTGSPANFSVTPFIGTSSLTAISDGSYKWQALTCDASDVCSSWTGFNATTPNLNIDNTKPTAPGNLTFVSRTNGSITVRFGASSTESNFSRYRIFYRKGSTTVSEADYEQSDTNLNNIEYNNAATTTIAGLSKSSWYTINIWAYDLAGNKASATAPLIYKTTAGYILGQTSYLIENDDGIGVNANTAPGGAGVPLSNVEKGQRLNVRIQIQNTGTDQTYNKRYKIQYENNTDAPNLWYDVGAATAISYSYGLSGANGDAITSRKAAVNGNTWSNGTWHEYTDLTNMYNLTLGHFTEFAFAVQTANATVGKTYRLRLIDGTGSSTCDTYTAYPTLSLVANDTKKYSKTNTASLSVNFSDLDYLLDNPGYTAVSSDNSIYDTITSAAGQYPVYNFVVKYSNTNYYYNAVWNGQSSVAPSASNIILQIYHFGSTNAWTTLATDNTTGANLDLNLNGLVDYHLSEYVNGGYIYWRAYQAAGSETLRSDYFVFTTSTPTAYVTGKHYRWRNDDAAYGTWREAQDTADPTLGTALAKNTNVRLRLSFANTKAGSAANYGFGLQYATTTTNCASGSFGPWSSVNYTGTSTSHFQMAFSSKFTNASSTSSQLSSDGYTYASGYMVQSPTPTSSAITLAEDRYAEVEFNIKATNNSGAGKTYCFRGTKNGVALNAYDRYAEVTIGGTNNTAPTFTSVPSDRGSATTTPTSYGSNVTFRATSSDAQTNQYYLAICQTNAITAGNGDAPSCPGGSWCISGRASSTKGASCTYNTNHQFAESLDWYGFACDYRWGAGVAKCSAVSQGQTGSPNASPFRVNHPPSFSAVTNLTDYLDPGGLFRIQATAADTDTNNTWSYHVCRTNSASSTGCNGGAANVVCSVTATTTANPICHYQNTAPSMYGAFTYYAFVFDNFGLGATTSPKISAYHINNVSPLVGNISLNSGSDITLNIKNAPDKQAQLISTSVTDQNGCDSLVSATAVVYRSGVGYNCAADNNNCYQIGTANCFKSACSGTGDAIATYNCTTSLKFFAQATDNTTGNPYMAENWLGRLQVYDGSNYTASTSQGVEVNANIALDVAEKNINFGKVSLGGNTGTVNQTTNVVNYGNSPINNNLAGTNLFNPSSAKISSVFVHWNLTPNFNYPVGNTLKNGGEVVTINLAKPTSLADVIGPIYWGVGVPATSTWGTFKGSSTFAAILNGSGSW